MSTKENPHRFFKRLSGRKDYKLRIGDIGLLQISMTKIKK